MKLVLLVFFTIIMSVSFSTAQNRQLIKGKVIADTDDIEGITLFNTSNNKGTITNAKGEFQLEVGVNDEIKVSALQFKKYTFNITKLVYQSKQLLVYLTERVNALDEVLLLEHELTGKLSIDVNSIAEVKPFVFKMPAINALNLYVPDDNKSGVVNIAIRHPLQYQANFSEILLLAGKLIGKIFPKNPSKAPKYTKILQAYTISYFVSKIGIPKEKVHDFVEYLEDGDFNYFLLNPENEIHFISYVLMQKEAYFN